MRRHAMQIVSRTFQQWRLWNASVRLSGMQIVCGCSPVLKQSSRRACVCVCGGGGVEPAKAEEVTEAGWVTPAPAATHGMLGRQGPCDADSGPSHPQHHHQTDTTT
jgi:hypothetical protein